MKRPKDGAELVRARKILDPRWKRCHGTGCKGRGSGCRARGRHSAYPGSNITLNPGHVIILVWQEGANGRLLTQSFLPAKRTSYELRVRRDLRSAGLKL